MFESVVLGTPTEKRDMVGRLGNVFGDVKQEYSEAEQNDNSNLDFLRRRAEED